MLLYAKVMVLLFSWDVYILLNACFNLLRIYTKGNFLSIIYKHNEDKIDMVVQTKHLKDLSLRLDVK